MAQYTAEKLIEMGARVVTMSDRHGFVHDPDGMTLEKVRWVEELKTARHGALEEYAREWGVAFHARATLRGLCPATSRSPALPRTSSTSTTRAR